MTRLAELDAHLVKIVEPRKRYQNVDDLKEADGVVFLCPGCFEDNHGARGTHTVICWFTHVDRSEYPRPGRWKPSGTGLDDLSLHASVRLDCWHGFVRNGKTSHAVPGRRKP